MGAWIVAWVDCGLWRDRVAADPAAVEVLGAALSELRPPDEPGPDGVGLLQRNGLAASFLETVPPSLITWAAGDFEVYWPSSPADTRSFLEQDSAITRGDVALVAVDHDRAERCSSLDVGQAVAEVLAGAASADLGGQPDGVRVQQRISWDDEVPLVWHRGALRRTDQLSASHRHEVQVQLAPPTRRAPLPAPGRPRLTSLWLQSTDGLTRLPYGPGSLTVLLGKNGAGKTTVLEQTALLLERLRGSNPASAAAGVLPSLARRSADQLLVDGRADLDVAQSMAPDLFCRLFFLAAYSPTSAGSPVLREHLPDGRDIWDGLSAVPTSDARDPRHVLDELDLPTLRAQLAAALADSVNGTYDRDALLEVFTCYLADDAISITAKGEVRYRPPAASAVLDAAERLSVESLNRLIGENPIDADAAGYARDAAFWALSAIDPRAAAGVAGMSVAHPSLGAFFTGWEQSPWTTLHDDVLAELRSALPAVTAFDPNPGVGGPDALAEQLVLQLTSKLLPREVDAAGDSHPFASTIVGPVAAIVAHQLGERATALLPAFAAEQGPLRVELAPQDQWHRRRAIVAMGPEPDPVGLGETASGVLAWGVAALRFAAAELLAADWSDGSQPAQTVARVFPDQLAPTIDGPIPLIYLADEPEVHLHPTAIKEVVEICDQLAGRSTGGVVAATHALDFLGRPEMDVATYVVESSRAEPCPPGLPALRERANHLGVTPATVLTTARAVLCVEGPTDEWAISTFAGRDLDRSFVHTVRLYGMNGLADRLPELDLIYSLDIPVYLLLDHVRRSKLEKLVRGEHVDDGTKEEKELARLAQALKRRRATVVPMAKVDVIMTIPDDAMAAAFESMSKTWRGWDSVTADIERRQRERWVKFKDALQAITGVSERRLLGALRALPADRWASPDLSRATASLLADLSDGGYRAAGEPLRILPAS